MNAARARVLLIDNYDSFVFNLARYLEELGCEPLVVRNDRIDIADVRRLTPAAIVLSPGPCTPAEAGICEPLIRELGASIPLLGVCLGHQAIATALGGQLARCSPPMHGRASLITHNGHGLFAGCPQPLRVGRYHSLHIPEDSLPSCLQATSWTDDRTVMSLAHREWPVWGVQFHPESILTDCGHVLLANFLQLAGIAAHVPASRELPDDVDSPSTDFYQQQITASLPRPY